jgi:hypothetical protein
VLPRLQRERYDNDKDKNKNHEGRDRKSAFGFALNEAKDFEEKTVAIGRHAGLRWYWVSLPVLGALSGS